VVCAAGIAVLDEIESLELVKASAEKGLVLHELLNQIQSEFSDYIFGISGKGLIASVIFQKNINGINSSPLVSQIAELCMQKGLLVVHTGRESIKIGPPLTISHEALKEGVEVLRESIAESLK
jgi:4-aminobutyrate aminotransferase-like enzyme